MRFLPFLQVFALFSTSVYAAIGPSANLYIANKFLQPDGFNRSTVLAGPTEEGVSFPGPTIIGRKNHKFSLNVIDKLTDTSMLTGTSIHWHGLFQRRTNYADGPVGVSQCPIISGNSFLYRFSAGEQAGTYWYHSHYGTQYCDGLRGVIVISDPKDPYLDSYDIDDESTIITLADWYHFPAPDAPPVPVTPNSTLINGSGRYSDGPNTTLSVISVSSGKRYRFRLVAMSCDPNYIFSIGGHTMTIIEADGINVEPLVVDSIQIFPGQRYSFILTANQTVDNYWIFAIPNRGTNTTAGGLNSAILRYVGAPNADPTTTVQSSSNPLVETNLHPLHDPAAPGTPTPGAADVNLNLDIEFNGTNYTVNNATFTEPSVPVLLQIISGASTAQSLLPSGSVYTLPLNKVIEISIPGGSVGSPHPIHLHGHSFSVIRSAGNSTYNFVNPVRRDVVSIGESTDNVTIRFKTDNEGPWIMHCHINWHLNVGLAIVLAEGVPAIAKTDPPAAWDTLCPDFNASLN